MKTIVLLLSAAVGLVSSYAQAEQSGLYLGAGIGRTAARFDTNDFNPQGSDFVGETATRDTGYKLFGGYDFNDRLAFEAGYADLGRFSTKWTAPSAGLFNNNVYLFDYRARSLFVAFRAALPVTERWAITGKFGVTINKAEDEYSLDRSRHIEPPLLPCPGPASCYPTVSRSPVFSEPGSHTKMRMEPLIGLGIEYRLLKQVALRLEYEDYGRFGDSNHTGRARVAATMVTFVFKL